MKDELARRDLKVRTREFALRIIKLVKALPKSQEAQLIGRQLFKAGTSVGAHYREAQRAKSNVDLVSKIEGGLQELEETEYWLELLGDSKIFPKEKLAALMKESDELIAIFVTIAKTTKAIKRRKDELAPASVHHLPCIILHLSSFILQK